jgi:hypothetical protein
VYVEIAGLAAAACLYVMAGALWFASRQVRAAAPLRDAAIAEVVVGAGLAIRAWAPDSDHGPVLVAATIAHGAHGLRILAALRRLRGWSPGTGWATAGRAGVSAAAALGLVLPAHAYAGLGLAYLLMAGLYAAITFPAFSDAEPELRAPLHLVGGC